MISRTGLIGFYATLDEALDAISEIHGLDTAERSKNLRTHTGVVHAPGRYFKQLRSAAPACCASVSAVSRYHWLVPTDAPVTCKRCDVILAKQAA